MSDGLVLVRVSRLAGHPHADVLDVDDLTTLSVRLDDVDVPAAAAALREDGLGEVDGEHAWLVVDRLRRSGPDDPAWTARFDAMIGYAASRHWLDDARTRVRAHLDTDSA